MARERLRRAQNGSSSASGSSGFEFYVNSGHTPVDVVMVETWDPDTIARLRLKLQKGLTIRITNAMVRMHSEKTNP